jgi:lambda family phage portal protein
MGFYNDLKFFTSNMGRVINSRPSRIAKLERDLAIMQRGFSHGVGVGEKRAQMYYPGAANGVLQGDWSTKINSSISTIRSDFKYLCARSEGAYRGMAVARRGINILTQYIVGQGNRPYPAIRDANGEPIEVLNSILAADWERFNDQSIRNGTQELTDYQAQALDFITLAVYGTVFLNKINSRKGSLLPYAFQSLKPYRLDFSKDTIYGGNYEEMPEKKIVHGIEINDYAEAQRFYFDNGRIYSADQMQMMFFPLETEQYLGVPWLTPVLPQVWDNQQLFDDKIRTSRIGAKLGMHMGKKDASGIAALLQNAGQTDAEYIELDYQGMYLGGEKPEPITITDPISNTFEPLIKMQMQYVAIGLGFSYQLFTSDLTGANFSSARMNKITDNAYFRSLYKWYVKARCQRRWEQFVQMEVYAGRLARAGVGVTEYQRDPWFYNQCFHLPMDSEGWVDPLKDIQALQMAYKLGQITYQEICSYGGKHYRAVIKQLQKERTELTDAGLKNLLPENINNVQPAQNSIGAIDENL